MTSPVRAARPAPRRAAPAAAPVRSRRPDLRIVEPTRRRRTVPIVCAATLVVFGSLLASAVLHSMLVTGQDRLDRMEREIDRQHAALEQDRLRLADSQSPSRIAKAAAKAGMVKATSQTWMSPDAPGVVVVTGGPADAVADPNATDQTGQTDQTAQTDPTAATGTGAAR